MPTSLTPAPCSQADLKCLLCQQGPHHKDRLNSPGADLIGNETMHVLEHEPLTRKTSVTCQGFVNRASGPCVRTAALQLCVPCQPVRATKGRLGRGRGSGATGARGNLSEGQKLTPAGRLRAAEDRAYPESLLLPCPLASSHPLAPRTASRPRVSQSPTLGVCKGAAGGLHN